MHSIAEFLESSPKNFLNQIHGRVKSGGGLVSNNKIIEEVKKWALSDDRIATILEDLTEEHKNILFYIYASGAKGIEFNRLQNSFKKFTKKELSTILDSLVWNLLIFKRKGAQPVFFGFADLFDDCFHKLEKSQLVFDTPNAKHWMDYSSFLPFHYFATIAYISQNNIKITASGDIHKKYLQSLQNRFSYSSMISETVSNDELDLILNFGYSSKHVMDGELLLSVGKTFNAFLNISPTQQLITIINWWEELRFSKNVATAKALLETIPTEAGSLHRACERWWVFDSTRKRNYSEGTEGMSWEDLPKIIRELWVFGLIELSMDDGKLVAIRRSALGNTWITGDMEGITTVLGQSVPFCTQDFEILYPVQAFGKRQFILEHIATPTNDDRLLKYTLSKVRLLEGMSSSIDAQDVIALKDSLTFPDIVSNNMTDWIAESTNSEICQAYLLKVHSSSKFEELKTFPEFLEHTIETIPGYGFVLKHGQEENVRELLSHFGLTPPTNTNEPKKFMQQLKENAISPTWKLAEPVYYDIDYSIPEPQTKKSATLKNSTYTAPPKNMGFAQILKNIKYAVLMEEQVEVVWHEVEESRAILNSSPKRNDETRRVSIVTPISLNQNKDPITLHSIIVDSNEDMYININEIEHIKILED
ncbi:MAG: hypothetical protein OCC49_15740 [Fibrobacterales bacterium]